MKGVSRGVQTDLRAEDRVGTLQIVKCSLDKRNGRGFR